MQKVRKKERSSYRHRTSTTSAPSFLFPRTSQDIFRAPDEVRGAKRWNLLKSLARPANPDSLFSIAQPPSHPPTPIASTPNLPHFQPVWVLSLKVNLLKSSSSGLVLRSQT